MKAFLAPLLDAILEQGASVVTILAYLGFVYATIGLANASRNRWEDLTIASAGSPTAIQSKAITQAATDFHNWYGSIILITNIAEVLALAGWLRAAAANKWTPIVWLVVMTIALIFGHIFCVQTYRKETREVLGESQTYRAFFPVSFILAGKP